MFRYIITPLLFCCLALPAAADDVQLQADHPERYVVVKGDTLWAISGKFLQNPWEWPKIWNMNRDEIKNPHWIYPGDEIVLDTSSGHPELRLLRETTVTLSPHVEIEPLEKEGIPTIAPNVIVPFLSQPLVVEQNQLKDAATIVGGQESRVVLSPGTKIYLDKISEGSSAFWQVYRQGKPLIDPKTGETLGIEAVFLGNARITKFGEPASAEIVRAKEEIFKGDKLIAAPETLMKNFVPHAPDSMIDGQIINIYGGVSEAGRNAIVSISRGTKDGLEIGHVLAIYRDGLSILKSKDALDADAKQLKQLKNDKTAQADPALLARLDSKLIKLPKERIGLLMVFRTFNRVSYGLIMQATAPINPLDIVQTP